MKTHAAIFAFMILGAVAGEKIAADVQWLKAKHATLTGITNSAAIQRAKVSNSESVNPNQRPFGYIVRPGLLLFPDKSWVILTGHSMHDGDAFGDVSLARASDGNYYVNRGHRCLDLLLESHERIASLDIFLKTTGKGDKGQPTKWEPYNPE